MQTLDSRNLGTLNCYAQKITGSGELMIEAGRASTGFLAPTPERAVKKKVKALPANRRRERKGGKQHVVPLKFQDNEFSLDMDRIEVQEGDTILFHVAERKLPRFAVRGTIGDVSFSSTELKDQAVFTHAFGLPGRYEWTDANGSGVGGVINVRNEPGEGKKGAERAMKRMSEGALVHIVGKKVEPRELTISTGQTVFFAVEQTDGITITDVTLLGKKR